MTTTTRQGPPTVEDALRALDNWAGEHRRVTRLLEAEADALRKAMDEHHPAGRRADS